MGPKGKAFQSSQLGVFTLVNCWPSESGSGCDVNIEYELQEDSLELNDVVIAIPLP